MTAENWPAGFAIEPRGPELDPDILAAFRGVPAAFVSDSMGRIVGSVGLLPFGVGPDTIMCGPALTVRTKPGDNLMIHKAFELVRDGDIMVVDAGGDVSQSVVGGNMRLELIHKGAAGLVIDGAIRDAAEFAEPGFPSFARAAQHRGPTKDGPGEINVPIACAGMTVHPGDLVIGDVDGVVVVPRERIPTVIRAVEATKAREARIRAAIVAGESLGDRFNEILRSKGVPV